MNKPLVFTGEVPQKSPIVRDDFTTDGLKDVEQSLFANPNDHRAIRYLACYVRQMGERLIAAEDELRMIRNAQA